MRESIFVIVLVAIVTSVCAAPCSPGEEPPTPNRAALPSTTPTQSVEPPTTTDSPTPTATATASAKPCTEPTATSTTSTTPSAPPTSSTSPPAAETKSCDGIKYDPEKQTCCKYTLFDGTDVACCGHNRLDSAKGEKCCGLEKPYDPTKETCCNDASFPQKYKETRYTVWPGVNLSCCGTVSYDPKKQSCCKGKPRDGVGWVCCRKDDREKCCDSSEFNPLTMWCCQGIRQPRRDNYICCGNNAYDPMLETCCPNSKVSAGVNSPC